MKPVSATAFNLDEPNLGIHVKSLWPKETVPKGEFVCCKQFLLLLQSFRNLIVARHDVCRWLNAIALSQTSPGFYMSAVQVF